MKIGVCPGDDLRTFYPSEADGQNVLDDSNSFRRTEVDVELVMNLTKFGSSHEKFDAWPRP